ncbi:hypothetical protein ACRQ5Q_17020 [Bradyrhizobium sp. PMVTL-01]|uniref:hypothetical protein n=1 Tax=Bradyrhizobium sp. PMVTL-01 TaxID=3434999 RepID=UPI003F721122
MKRLALLFLLLSSPAFAQQQGSRPTTEKDVTPLSQPIVPEPEHHRITIPFGETARIYFKRSIRSVRIADTEIVSAQPESDHVVEFRAMAPGESRFDLEANDGEKRSGTIVVYGELHEIKVYTPVPADKQKQVPNAGVVIIQAPEGGADAKKSAEAEYSSRLCNEVGCRPVPQTK